MADWGYRPHWRPMAATFEIDDLATTPPQTWLLFEDDTGLGRATAKRLLDAGHRVTTVRAGDTFARVGDNYVLSPERAREGYDLLLRDLVARGLAPNRILHLWLVTAAEPTAPAAVFCTAISNRDSIP